MSNGPKVIRASRGAKIVAPAPATPEPQKTAPEAVPEAETPATETGKPKATQADLARHIDVSPQRVKELAAQGIIPKYPRGEVDIDEARIAYIRHMREAATRSNSDKSDERKSAELRKLQAEADRAEARAGLATGDLIPTEIVLDIVQPMYANTRMSLLALPEHMAQRVVGLENLKAVAEILRLEMETALSNLDGDTALNRLKDRAKRGFTDKD